VLSIDDISDIRAYIQQQRALGNGRFRETVERKLGGPEPISARGQSGRTVAENSL